MMELAADAVCNVRASSVGLKREELGRDTEW